MRSICRCSLLHTEVFFSFFPPLGGNKKRAHRRHRPRAFSSPQLYLEDGAHSWCHFQTLSRATSPPRAPIKVADSTLGRRIAPWKHRTKRPALISLLYTTGGDGWAHHSVRASTIDEMTRDRAIAPPSAATAKSPHF